MAPGAEKRNVKGKYNLLDGEEIRLTALGEGGWTGSARILQVNAPVVVVECATYVQPGAAIRVDSGDALLLGECRRCEPDCGRFKAEVKLEQVIPSVSDLAKLMVAIRGTSEKPTLIPDAENTPAHATLVTCAKLRDSL